MNEEKAKDIAEIIGAIAKAAAVIADNIAWGNAEYAASNTTIFEKRKAALVELLKGL